MSGGSNVLFWRWDCRSLQALSSSSQRLKAKTGVQGLLGGLGGGFLQEVFGDVLMSGRKTSADSQAASDILICLISCPHRFLLQINAKKNKLVGSLKSSWNLELI